MTIGFFICAFAALFLTRSLRLPGRGSVVAGMVAFGGGLLVTLLAIRGLAATANIGLSTDFDRVVNGAVAVARQDPAPLIVFTGASYSRNGIDPERLTLALREAGYTYRVINVSLEAASILERDQHVQQFIALSGRVPALVFVEVAAAFDNRAAFMFANSKFTARAIEQFDPVTSWHTAKGIAQGACSGPLGCIKDAVFLVLHTTMNTLNLGLIGQGEHPDRAGILQSWDPQYSAREPIDFAPLMETEDTDVSTPDWVLEYRADLRARLLAEGVRAVGYYLPPVISPFGRAYMRDVCGGELAAFTCISPDDPDLLKALQKNVWRDESHLLDAGAQIYNHWLADQLIASGILESGS